MSGLDRRSFLEASISCVIAAAGLVIHVSCGGETEEHLLALQEGFGDLDSMAEVGRLYLESSGETLPTLLDEVRLGRGWSAVDDEIREQYRSGDLVSVGDWPLARTEARIYALVAVSVA